MNTLQALEKFPGYFALYLWGLLGAVLDDYALTSLAIFTTLLGFITGSVLIALAAFFGLYFVLRLVANLADAVGFHAKATSQATMQVAGVLSRPVTIADDQDLTLNG